MRAKSNKIVLVTGFTPFAGETVNPSWEIAKALPDVIATHRIEKLRVPTEFGKSIDVVARAIDKLKPSIVLCLGQAGGRSRITVERVAINVDDARIADNAGVQLIDTPIRDAAPAAYFSTLPIKAMVDSMSRAGVPAEVSNTAGTFVCNHLLYGVLHHTASNPSIRAGFMHVPFVESQIVYRADTPAMSLAIMIEGVKAAIIAAIKTRTDLKLTGGTEH
jgi:pyroglutamyl-peptidase